MVFKTTQVNYCAHFIITVVNEFVIYCQHLAEVDGEFL